MQEGHLTREGHRARWRHLAARDPQAALAGLLYLGYEGELAQLFSVSRFRRTERKSEQPSRNLFQARHSSAVRRRLSASMPGHMRATRGLRPSWCCQLG